VILIIAAIGEGTFLLGSVLWADSALMTGSIVLTCAAAAGFLLVPFQSADLLYRELNTKQSYMLFLTPRSPKSILGAKILTVIIWLAVQGVVFGIFSCVDAGILYRASGSTEGLLSALLSSVGGAGFSVSDLVLFAAKIIGMTYGFILSVLMAYFFAEIVQSTVLNGRKGGVWFSLLIFVILFIAFISITGRVTAAVPEAYQFAVAACMDAACVVLFFFLASSLMEKKLSV
jgi:hypothetical protein